MTLIKVKEEEYEKYISAIIKKMEELTARLDSHEKELEEYKSKPWYYRWFFDGPDYSLDREEINYELDKLDELLYLIYAGKDIYISKETHLMIWGV